MQIPEKYRDLLTSKAIANLATIMPDGSPQVTPVWFDFDGTHIRVNSALDRTKDKNMRRDPRVALSISDPSDPYRHFEVRGRVVSITEDGAVAHIDSLALRYVGTPKYLYHRVGERRVIYLISVDKVTAGR